MTDVEFTDEQKELESFNSTRADGTQSSRNLGWQFSNRFKVASIIFVILSITLSIYILGSAASNKQYDRDIRTYSTFDQTVFRK